MLLKQLLIKKGDKLIRLVEFKSGLNLITSSSNSVGKTTLLRSVDYCLGSDGKDFYTDTEFKGNINNEVLSFLSDNIIFTLDFVLDGKNYTINRVFGTTKGLRINTVYYNDLDAFKKELNLIIFGIDNKKPGLRNMLSKFIRKDVLKMKNMLKTLHSSSSENDYMLFNFHLFHFQEPELIYEKYELKKSRLKIAKRITAVKGSNTKNSLKQKVKLLDEDIKVIDKKIRDLDLIKSGDYSLDRLSKIQKDIYGLRTRKGKLNLKLGLNKESLFALSKQKSNIKTEYIEEIYNSAKVNVINLQKTLEDTIKFHNTMVNNKINFITKTTNSIENDLMAVNKDLRLLEMSESEILKSISDKDKFANLYKLQAELAHKSQKKGEEKKLLDLIEELEGEKKKIVINIEEIDKKISIYTKDFDENVFIFNKYFSQYSKELYNSKYLISFSDDYKDVIPENIDFNVGGGEKKAYIGLFDLAYISYLNDKGSNYCKFILHDSVEDTNPLSLKKIFDITNTVKGQYIVSLLEDKINNVGIQNISENIILSLSDNNKFFKIENTD